MARWAFPGKLTPPCPISNCVMQDQVSIGIRTDLRRSRTKKGAQAAFPLAPAYSERNARMGSTTVARRAGTDIAISMPSVWSSSRRRSAPGAWECRA